MITFDGRPLENATVELTPVDGGRATAQTNAHGRLELEEGVAPGEYKVRIIHEISPTRGEETKAKAGTGRNPGGDGSEVKSGR